MSFTPASGVEVLDSLGLVRYTVDGDNMVTAKLSLNDNCYPDDNVDDQDPANPDPNNRRFLHGKVTKAKSSKKKGKSIKNCNAAIEFVKDHVQTNKETGDVDSDYAALEGGEDIDSCLVYYSLARTSGNFLVRYEVDL